MSFRTRIDAPGRGRTKSARRVKDADRVKSGAAQRAYARRKLRAEQTSDAPVLPSGRASVMAGRIPFVVAIIALLGCGLALTLLLTTRAAEDSYQLSDARATNRKLAEERAALLRQVEAADSPPELAARARELGMIPAKDPARLILGPDGTVTVIGKPTPAQGAPVPPLNVSPTAPSAPQAGNAQARGERVVPVPTTRLAPLPVAPPPGTDPNPVGVQASPLPPSPAPGAPAPEQAPVAGPPPSAPAPAPAAPAAETPQPEPLPNPAPQPPPTEGTPR